MNINHKESNTTKVEIILFREVLFMFEHKKQLLRDVKVERINPQYAVLMQEQLGGGNGELKAAMQYISQSFRVKDPEIKDLFLDIGAEELSHMEMVAQTINLLNGHEVDNRKVENGEIETHVLAGLSPVLINSSGEPWTANYVTVTGDLVADLLSNIASEQRAKVVYEYLYRQIQDKEVRATIDFLLNREEAHNALFREALNKVQNTGSNKDFGVTNDSKLYFDLSTPGPSHKSPSPTPASFESPNKENDRVLVHK
ncbi:Catalase [Clostridium sp. DL-VIII]|nr:Catalase [Clostridium sp. DL-VIII]